MLNTTDIRASVAHDTVRRPIPVRQDLGLPGAVEQAFGLRDLQYDTAALVWARPAPPPLEAPRAPPVAPAPRSTGGLTYEVKARGVRFWLITAHSVDLAWDEVHRLCEASGYDATDVILSLVRAEPTMPARRVRPGRVLSTAEVRARLLVDKGICAV